jgi:hypothetical protein
MSQFVDIINKIPIIIQDKPPIEDIMIKNAILSLYICNMSKLLLGLWNPFSLKI